MPKKRVLYIQRAGSRGGSVISLLKLIEYLNKDLYEPMVLFYDPSSPFLGRFTEVGAKVVFLDRQLAPKRNKLDEIRLGNRLEQYSSTAAQLYRLLKSAYRLFKGDLIRAWRVRQILVENQIDLVHHNQWGQETVMAAGLVGIPQICHVRALGKMGPFDRWLARFVRTFIYVSSAIAAYYEAQGIPSHKGQTILNGVTMEEFTAPQETETLRQEFGFQPEDILVGNIGRLVGWKGYEFFLKAVAELSPAWPNLKALIVGEADNTPESQAYKEKLIILTESLGLTDKVIFTGFRTDIPRIITSLDVIVHSAIELEPGGRTLIETMAAGTPLVASKAGGILDIAEDGVHALLVPPEDVHAIAEAVKRLLTDAQLAQRLSQAGRCRVFECCTVERYASLVQSIYQVVLNQAKPEKLARVSPNGIS